MERDDRQTVRREDVRIQFRPHAKEEISTANERQRLDALHAAYLATDYVVHAGEDFFLRIGECCALLDALLSQHGVESWAFVTACNPGSQALADDDNAERMRRLEREVSAKGFPFLLGDGAIPDRSWPAEPSLLILGIDEAGAREIAERYGQLAFVCGTRGQAARLVWSGTEPSPPKAKKNEF
jgi:hypothetical protein